MIKDLVYRICPNCKLELLCDELFCGCIIGKCFECSTDFNITENCNEK